MATNGTDLLQRLSNAIAGAVNPTEKQMTQDEFISYCNSEVIAMVKDPPDVAKRRLSALEGALAQAKKSKPGELIRVKMFAVDNVANPDPTSSEQMPPKSDERGSETGKGINAMKKTLDPIIEALQAIAAGGAAPVSTSADAATSTAVEGEQGKALPPPGGGGAKPHPDAEEEDDEEMLAMGKRRVKKSDCIEIVDEGELFPLDMNSIARSKTGKLYRQRHAWGDDPKEVRSVG